MSESAPWEREKSHSVKTWRAFVATIYGTQKLAPTQERECSACFYAGMMAAFEMMSTISAGANDDQDGEDQAVAHIEALRTDIACAAKDSLRQR